MQLKKLNNSSKSGYVYSMNVSDISYLLGVGSICEPLLKVLASCLVTECMKVQVGSYWLTEWV